MLILKILDSPPEFIPDSIRDQNDGARDWIPRRSLSRDSIRDQNDGLDIGMTKLILVSPVSGRCRLNQEPYLSFHKKEENKGDAYDRMTKLTV
jgi:hypothetical protein